MFNFRRRAKNRWLKYYSKSRWPIIVDIASVFTVFGLLVLFLSLYFYNPQILIGPNYQKDKPIKPDDSYVIDLDNPPLETKMVFKNLSLNESNRVAQLEVELNNNSPLEIKDLKIRITSVNNNLSLRDIYPELDEIEGVKFINNNELIINSLNTEEQKKILLNLQFFWSDFGGKKANLKIETEYIIKDQLIKKFTIIESPIIESQLEARAIMLYTGNNGDKLGLGPIPPIVGLPTNYWLFFEVNNFGDVKNVIMTGHLPLGVNFTDRHSLLDGGFSYDSDNRLIIWRLDEIKDGEDGLRLGVELQFIPEESQINSSPNLIENIEYFAKDPYSGRTLSGTIGSINTNLPDDRFNKNLGEIKASEEY
ncbi:hypothetical protein GW758_01045 [Candidatus Falkowbacteria bacterium]|nr:hypothetical protein [Candidatus Falkowbacteria bacterium]